MKDYVLYLLYAGGIIHLCFVCFQMFFWRIKLMNWKEELPRMSPVNRFCIQMCNLAVMVAKSLIAYVSLLYPHELVTSGLGRVLLFWIVFFWLMRLIGEFIFKENAELGWSVLFIIIILLYLIPALTV